MAPVYQWSRLENFTSLQWHAVCMIRESVFVVEQSCAYQEIDDLDICSWHLVGWKDDTIVTYLRVIDPGRKFFEVSIGRVLTNKLFRGKSLGIRLMEEAIRRIEATYPVPDIRISAQSYLLDFYVKLGFKKVSEEYMEDTLPHIEMLRTK